MTSESSFSTQTARPDRATTKEWAGLVLLSLPMIALATDLTVLFFALPTLSADLEPSASQTLWITHIYGFLIAGFLVTAGRLGDRVGPRRLLLVGSTAFAGLSALAAFSTSPEMLVAARAALGIAGATLMPSLFSLLRTMFRDDMQRRTAIAIMFSTFTVGGAIGPVLGGALLEFFWWGSVFLINVPPMLLLIGGKFLLPERAERNRAGIDLVSVGLSVLGMLTIVFGFQELAASADNDHAAWPYLLSIAVGAMLMVFFVLRQLRLTEPLFDMVLLQNRPTATSLITLLLMGTCVTGLFYLFTQHLQWVGGLSPLHAGLWTLPFIVFNIAGALVAPALTRRLRPATVIIGGLLISATGAAFLALSTGDGSWGLRRSSSGLRRSRCWAAVVIRPPPAHQLQPFAGLGTVPQQHLPAHAHPDLHRHVRYDCGRYAAASVPPTGSWDEPAADGTIAADSSLGCNCGHYAHPDSGRRA